MIKSKKLNFHANQCHVSLHYNLDLEWQVYIWFSTDQAGNNLYVYLYV